MTQNYITNPKDNKGVKEVKSMICEKAIYHAVASIAAIGQTCFRKNFELNVWNKLRLKILLYYKKRKKKESSV